MLIPERLVNFQVWGGNGATALLGMTDVELPKFDPIVEKIQGAGIAGEYDSPVLGHFQSQSVKLKWRVVDPLALGLLAPVHHSLQLRGAVQVQDTQLGILVTQPVRVDVRGPVKSYGLGKFEPGKAMDPESEIEVASISVFIAGIEIVHLDKFNYIFKVNGVDYLTAVRTALGI